MSDEITTLSRWMAVALAVALIALVAGGAWFYRSQEQAARQAAIEQLASIGRLKVNQIVEWREEQLSDASILMDSPFLAEALARFREDSLDENAEALSSQFRSLQSHGGYDDVLLVDPVGRVRLSLTGKTQGHAGYRAALTSAFSEHKPVLTDLHSAEREPTPHISVVAPIFSVNKPGSLPLGGVVLVSNASRFLYPLIQSWPTPSKTAETLLVCRDGDEVLFLNDLRHQPDAALNLRIPLSQTEVPAVMAVLGHEGVVQGKDYRGVEVLSDILAVPDSDWFMVAKQDVTEILAAWRFRGKALVLLFVVMGGGIVAIGLVVLQRNKKAHYRALYAAEAKLRASVERHSVTLKAIGDAVIATDAEGRVELLNHVAETLTGWMDAEARERPLDEVFHIINEETRERSEDPVARVLREGTVVGLANHTLLVAKDGSERPIADSGAPIRNADGTITGVVLVFRDQTVERAVNAALQQNHAMLARTERIAHVGSWEWDIHDDRVRWSDELFRIFQRDPAKGAPPFAEHANLYVLDDKPRWEQAIESCRTEGTPYELELHIVRADGEIRYCVARGQAEADSKGHVHRLAGSLQDVTVRRRLEGEQKKLQSQLHQAQKMEAVGHLAGGVAHDFNNILQGMMGYSGLLLDILPEGEESHEFALEISQGVERASTLIRQLLAFARRQTIAPQVLDLNETVDGILKMLRRLIGEDINLAWLPDAGLWPVKMDPAQIDQLLANLAVNARDAIGHNVGKVTIETENATFDEAHCAIHAGYVPGDYVLLAFSDDGCGMDENTRQQIFEPFFTTKEVGKGTGLGLATVYGIVKQNNGFINVYSEPGKGTTFRIYLPRHIGAFVERVPGRKGETPVGRGETVLLVEDDGAILNLGRRMLEDLGYKVVAAGTPGRALELAREANGTFHLLLTDVVMPEMSGRDLAERLRGLCPNLRTLFMSGYTANVIAHRGVLDESVNFIHKPFSKEALAGKVREVLDQPA